MELKLIYIYHITKQYLIRPPCLGQRKFKKLKLKEMRITRIEVALPCKLVNVRSPKVNS